MTLQDLSLSPPTEASVQQACDRLDAWVADSLEERGRCLVEVREERDDFEATHLPEYALWERVPFQIERLVRKAGVDMLEQWWEQQGRSLYWQSTTQTPRPEVGHLLVYAARKGAFSLMRWALQEGWSPDVREARQERMTPVHHMIGNPLDHIDTFEGLFKKLLTPTTLKSCTKEGMTPLALLAGKRAAWSSDHKRIHFMFHELLAAGADINMFDSTGKTPLHHHLDLYGGSEAYAFPLLKSLLEAGADPCVRMTQAPFLTVVEQVAHLEKKSRSGFIYGTHITTLLRTMMEAFIRQSEAVTLDATLSQQGRGLKSPSRSRL